MASITWFATTTSSMPINSGVSRDVSTSDPFATTSAHGQFIFDHNQNLWWNADGSGSAQAIPIAGFGETPPAVVTETDLIVGP